MSDVLINVGCGDAPLPGFVNLDLDRAADIRLDVRDGLPFADGTVDGVYSEHFVEHLTQAELVNFLRECRRVLRPGGTVRMATPDLAELVRCYGDPDWLARSGLVAYGYEWLANPCELLNLGMREWGHRHVVDETELSRLALLAGLEAPVRCAIGESGHAAFRGRETREGAHLVIECRRPEPAPADHAPLVSVLIAAYEPRWFEAALVSARRQTYADLEILVGDDGPGQEIGEICRRHAAEDPRVSCVRNPRNLGEIDNWQALFSRARGEYVKCLADDDLLAPDCVARQAAVLSRYRDVTLVSSYRRLIDEEGAELPDDFNAPLAPVDVRLRGRDAAALMLEERRNFIGEPTTCLFRRVEMADARPTLMSFGGRRALTNADVSMWCHLLGKGDLVVLREPLSAFRQRGDQTCRSAEHKESADRAWDLVRQDALRLGLWAGSPLRGGRVSAAPLESPPPPPPQVSLVLPAGGALADVVRGLDALSREPLRRPCEFLVVDVGLEPAARRYLERVAASRPGVILRDGPATGARAAAVDAVAVTARGAVLAVADLDAAPPTGWLAAAVAALVRDDSLAAVAAEDGNGLTVRTGCFARAGGCGGAGGVGRFPAGAPRGRRSVGRRRPSWGRRRSTAWLSPIDAFSLVIVICVNIFGLPRILGASRKRVFNLPRRWETPRDAREAQDRQHGGTRRHRSLQRSASEADGDGADARHPGLRDPRGAARRSDRDQGARLPPLVAEAGRQLHPLPPALIPRSRRRT